MTLFACTLHYLAMAVQNCSKKSETVWKSLGPCTLSHRNHTMLVGMEYAALHWTCTGDQVHIYTGNVCVHYVGISRMYWTTTTIKVLQNSKNFTCFPIGSGLVTVVLKNPSHSSLPYSPAQWLCLFPVCGRHHGMRVLFCLSAGSHDLPSAHWHTPLKPPFLLRPFFLSWWV